MIRCVYMYAQNYSPSPAAARVLEEHRSENRDTSPIPREARSLTAASDPLTGFFQEASLEQQLQTLEAAEDFAMKIETRLGFGIS